MATINHVRSFPGGYGYIHHVIWANLTHDDTGEAVMVAGAVDKVVQLAGTVGSDDSVVWEGSCELGTPTNWFTLHDAADGSELTYSNSSGAGATVMEGPIVWLRPRGAAGTAQSTDVDAILTMVPSK